MTLILCAPIYTELQNSMDSRMCIVYVWVSECVSVCVFTAGVGLCLCVRGVHMCVSLGVICVRLGVYV